MDRQLKLPVWQPAGFDSSKLSEDETCVYYFLQGHAGLARAIKQRDLARECWPGCRGDQSRRLQIVLKALTENHGIAIGTSCRSPMGVYLIECSEELELYRKNLFKRALSGLRRYAKLGNVHGAELAGQIRLAIENG